MYTHLPQLLQSGQL